MNMSCDRCSELNVEYQIPIPGALRKVVTMVGERVSDGTDKATAMHSNKELERLQFDRFLGLMPDIQGHAIQESEQPDFLVALPTKRLGVELARLYHEPSTGTKYRDSTKRRMPKHWFDEFPHTHVALDYAIEQGALFCNMLAFNRAKGRD